MKPAAVLFALPIEASILIGRLNGRRKIGDGLYAGRICGRAVRVGISGVGRERAAVKAQELLLPGVEMLVACGYAAGLDDSLASGDLVVANSVVDESSGSVRSWMCDEQLTHLASGICLSEPRSIASVASVVKSTRTKAEVFARLECAAAEMESGATCSVAHEFGVPLVVVRAIVDTLHQPMPRQFAAAMRDDGTVQLLTILEEVLRSPMLLIPMLRLGASSRRCSRGLADFLCEFLQSTIDVTE